MCVPGSSFFPRLSLPEERGGKNHLAWGRDGAPDYRTQDSGGVPGQGRPLSECVHIDKDSETHKSLIIRSLAVAGVLGNSPAGA